MKKSFLIVALVLAGGSLWAQDFSARQHVSRQARPAKKTTIVTTRPVDGAVQKAVRSGNPLQMLNPFAPREYGDGAECVYHDENDNFQNRNNHEAQPKGIRLFAFAW